jgi:hypothetical protein
MSQLDVGVNLVPAQLIGRLHELLGNNTRQIEALQHVQARRILGELDLAVAAFDAGRGYPANIPNRPFPSGNHVNLPIEGNGFQECANLDRDFDTDFYNPPTVTNGGYNTTNPLSESFKAYGRIRLGVNVDTPASLAVGRDLRAAQYDPYACAIVQSSVRLQRLLYYYVIANENFIHTRTSVISFLSLINVDEMDGSPIESIGERITRRDGSLRSTIDFLASEFRDVPNLNRASRLLRHASAAYPTLVDIFLDLQNPTITARLGILMRILAGSNHIDMEIRFVLGRRRNAIDGQGLIGSMIGRRRFEEIIRLERRRSAGYTLNFDPAIFNDLNDYNQNRDLLITSALQRYMPEVDLDSDEARAFTIHDLQMLERPIEDVRANIIRVALNEVGFSIQALLDIIRDEGQRFLDDGGEYYDLDYDAFIIESITFVEGTQQLLLTQQTPFLPDLVYRYLHQLRAFRNTKDVLWATRQLQEPSVPFTGERRQCVLEAFFGMRLIQTEMRWATYPYAERKRLLCASIQSFKDRFGEVLDNIDMDRMSLYKWMDLLLSSEVNDDVIEPGVMVVLYNGIGKPLTAPMMWISYVDHRLEISFPRQYEWFEEDEFSKDQLVLVYYKAHLFVSSLGVVRNTLEISGNSKERVRELTEKGLAESYVLSPVNIHERDATVARAEAARLKSLMKGGPDASIQGSYDKFNQIDHMSYDLETGRCDRCSIDKRKNIQHAMVCSIAGDGWVRTFCGTECEAEYKDSSMETYNGCITQALRYIKLTMGFFMLEGNRRPARVVLNRYFWAFNGGAFDAHFVWRVLNGWAEPVEFIEMSGNLVPISYGNLKFVDFRKIYDGSLDKVHKAFMTLEGAHNPPPASKLRCFPYNLISNHANNEWVTGSDLEEDWIWGDRRATVYDQSVDKEVPYMPHLSLGKANASWWRENMDERGYRSAQLIKYCELDTEILQWCVDLHVQVLCKGRLLGRDYNLSKCVTGPGMALCLLQQCFISLEESFSAPPANIILPGLYDSETNEDIYLSRVVTDAMKGGLVDVYRTHMNDPDEVHLWDEHKQKTGEPHIIVGLDVNSMYPHVMFSQKLPIRYEGHENRLESPIIFEPFSDTSTLVDHNLYLCDIEHHGEGTTMIRVAGHCFCPNKIPFKWVDPTRKRKGKEVTVFNFIFGVELKGCIGRGAKVICHYVLKYSTTNIMMEYVRELYQRRSASTSRMMNLFWKKMMNSLYGKFGQKGKESVHILENMLDVLSLIGPGRTITGISYITSAHGGYDRVMVRLMDATKPTIGQLNIVSAYVTAVARSYLTEIQREVVKLPSRIGRPIRLYYGDTDSFYVDALIPEQQRTPGDITSKFCEKYMSDSVLGKLKLETDNIVQATFKAKKTYQVEQELGLGQTYRSIKAKGFNNELINWFDMLEIGKSRQASKFACREGFGKDLKLGVFRLEENREKRMSYGNFARQAPDVHGEAKCWEDIPSFLANKERYKTRAMRDEREMIIPE